MCCSLLEVIPLPSVKGTFACLSSKTSSLCSTTILSLRASCTSLHLLHFCLPPWTYLPWGSGSGSWQCPQHLAQFQEPRRYLVFVKGSIPCSFDMFPLPCSLSECPLCVQFLTRCWTSHKALIVSWRERKQAYTLVHNDLPEIKALSTRGSMTPTPWESSGCPEFMEEITVKLGHGDFDE